MKLHVRGESKWPIVSERKTEALNAKNALMHIHRNKIWSLISTLLMAKKSSLNVKTAPKRLALALR